MAAKTDNSPELLNLYHSRMESVQYAFKNGEIAVFKNFRYATSKARYIEELNAEVLEEHPIIYIDENRKTVTQAELAPDYELRKSIRAEVMAELAASRDFGNSSGPGGAGTGIATTASIGALAVGSNEGGVVGALAQSGKQVGQVNTMPSNPSALAGLVVGSGAKK